MVSLSIAAYCPYIEVLDKVREGNQDQGPSEGCVKVSLVSRGSVDD